MRIFLLLLTGFLMACNSPDTDSISTSEPVMELAGSEWNLGDGSDAFVAFKSDGKVIGSGGCNNFNGQYTQNEAAVEIGPLATTRKLCPPEIMETENRLLGLLKSARFARASHLKLTLIDAEKNDLATLNRSDWD